MNSALSIVMLSSGLFAGQFCPSCASGTVGHSVTAVPAYGAAVPAEVVVDGGFGAGGTAGQLYPFDSPEPWLHGYFQEIPAYGGFRSFQPYNYRHVFGQVQAAAAWGMGAMPYSQQFWHRYADRASLKQRATPYAPRNTMPQSHLMAPSANAAAELAGRSERTWPGNTGQQHVVPRSPAFAGTNARGEVAPVAADFVTGPAPSGPGPANRNGSDHRFVLGADRPSSAGIAAPRPTPQPTKDLFARPADVRRPGRTPQRWQY